MTSRWGVGEGRSIAIWITPRCLQLQDLVLRPGPGRRPPRQPGWGEFPGRGTGSGSDRRLVGLVAGPGEGRETAASGPSRSPRVLARLVRIRKIQVFRLERSSKRSIPVEDRQPGLLHDLLGGGAISDVHLGNAEHHRRPYASINSAKADSSPSRSRFHQFVVMRFQSRLALARFTKRHPRQFSRESGWDTRQGPYPLGFRSVGGI